jgi:hypothetical protein
MRPYFFGVICQGQFVCSTPESIGFGHTPLAAYEDWFRAISKTRHGRWFQRKFNAVLDIVI